MNLAIWMQGGIGGGNFSQGYPPLLGFVQRLGEHHRVTVYSILPANADFEAHGFSFRSAPAYVRGSLWRMLWLSALFLRDHLRRRYDVLHAFWVYPAGTLMVLLGKLVRRPTIVTVQGGEAAAVASIGYGNMLRPRLKQITLWTCTHATHLNVISKYLVVQLHHHGLKRTDISVTPFGASRDLFPYHEKIEDGVLKIIHVANLTPVKDQYTLLRAFAMISSQVPAHLRIVGADYMDGKIQRDVERLGLNNHVTFAGPVPQTLLAPHYAWADMMLHTSLHEGQSGVVAEAMASGVVVCGTAVGMLYDLSPDYLRAVPVGDADALASQVLQLIQNPTDMVTLRQKAYERASRHDAHWTTDAYLDLYAKVRSQ